MASKKKTVVGKDDLRRLMKEQRNSSSANTKRIDSPLAKYNSFGQLSCALCNAPVKSALMWNAHIQGKTHKENLATLRAQKEAVFLQPAAPAVKRKPPDDGHSVKGKIARIDKGGAKQSTSDLPADFFDSPSKTTSKSTAGLGLGDYSSSDEEDEGAQPAPAPSVGSDETTPAVAGSSGLPADFFDQGVVPSAPLTEKTSEEEEEQKPQSMAEKLPEGFFDDPKLDAKIRKVEYKDKMDEEWELFQKAMKEETTISEAIMEVEEDEATVEREIEEIDEQMQRWSKVDRLQKQKEEMMTKDSTQLKDTPKNVSKKEEKEEDGESDDVDQQDLDAFLNWRAKQAAK